MQPVDRHKLVNRATQPLEEPLGGQRVHYYWGVPFCPRGLDPDKYTKVTWMHVYVFNPFRPRALLKEEKKRKKKVF